MIFVAEEVMKSSIGFLISLARGLTQTPNHIKK